jgi:tRNA-specific 2-thiouridylase
MKIAVLVSGGVDSSVALRLLKDAGHELTAYYIKIWMEDKFSHLGKCPWEDDLRYVDEICDELEIPLEIVSLQKEYWQLVVKEAVAEVKRGRTPNPDIWCNQRVKFGVLYKYIGKGYDKVATGHYANIVEKNRKFYLTKSADQVKDQTYFLAFLNQAQLSRAMFPIGELTKAKVRQLAKQYDLPNQDRKDSQGICFLGKIKYRDFLKEHLGVKSGKIVNQQTGEVLGSHDGYWYYTIGQRKDIKLSGGPWYVVAKDVKQNIVYIANSYELDQRARDTFLVSRLHWITQAPTKLKLQVKIRHGEKSYGCRIKFINQRKLEVKLAKADQGVAAGQMAVLYDGQVCLGGGMIS